MWWIKIIVLLIVWAQYFLWQYFGHKHPEYFWSSTIFFMCVTIAIALIWPKDKRVHHEKKKKPQKDE